MSPDSKGASQPVPKLVPAEILEKIARIVGPHGVVAEAAEIEPFLTDERGVFTGRTAMMVRPGSTQEVAEILRLCNEARVPIVPQGGNTSSVGAATPHGDGGEILLSMTRMNRILGIDPLNNAITLEAGVILADVQKAAEEADRLFPLSLGGEGTARIGGNLSTNAGGTGVLRYGNTRDLTMGIEAVLADGRVWDGMTALRKDNTGYDLKQLFIGAEGTLGVITACVMKLFPRPRDVETAFAAVPGPGEAVELLALARTLSGEVVSSFEWMARRPLGFVLDHIEGTRDPLPKPHDHYVLIEFASTDASDKMRAILEAVLAAGLEKGLVLDAAIAETAAHARDFWRLRETMPKARSPKAPASSTTSRCRSRRSPNSSPRRPRRSRPNCWGFVSAPSATSATATCTTTCRNRWIPMRLRSGHFSPRSTASSTTSRCPWVVRSRPSTVSACCGARNSAITLRR